MKSICLLFAGQKGLNDSGVRQSILRIPEVSRKLKEAQQALEHCLSPQMPADLFSFLQSTDEEFNGSPHLKSLIAGIVQIGLFERLVRYRSRPEFLVGRTNSCSAMKVCAELQSFYEFISSSDYVQENSMLARFTKSKTKLSGALLEECGVYKWHDDGHYECLEIETKDAINILEELSSDYLLQQCIHVGPYYDFRVQEMEQRGLLLPSMSSIDLDPILNSFWKSA